MANTHPIVRLDKIQAIYNGNIESLIHTSDVKNGSVCNVGALKTGESEVKELAIPATATLGVEPVVLVAAPEVNYEAGKNLGDFQNIKNKPFRAYHLVAGDIFTVTYDAITCLANSTPVLGNYVTTANTSVKLTEVDSVSTNRFYGKIIALTTLGFDANNAAVIQVIKA